MNNQFNERSAQEYALQSIRSIGEISQPRNRHVNPQVNPVPNQNQPLLPSFRSAAGRNVGNNDDVSVVYQRTSPVFSAYRTASGGPCSLGRTTPGRQCNCPFCGINHPQSRPYQGRGAGDADSTRRTDCPGGGTGTGSGGDSGGGGDGGGGKDSGGGGDGGKDSGGGDDKKKDDSKKDDKGSDGGSGGGGGGPPYLNADDPNVCPDWASDAAFLFLLLTVASCLLGVFACRGSPSIKECMRSAGGSGGCGSGRWKCDLNPRLKERLNKNKTCRGGGKGKSQMTTDDIPEHLKEQYDNFKNALADKDCLHRFEDKCDGLINYAGTMAGGSIVTTRDTQAFHNPMLCRCHDAGSPGKLCDPGDAVECSDCRCEQMQADTLIKEDEKLTAGRCWAFSGVGKVMIRTFYPIIVTGVSIHHPAKKKILPGYWNSAPREFEVWGYNTTDDPDPFLFGKFEYLADSTSSQVFEVKNFTTQTYDDIQFNFLNNHGNKNYTSVYKVDVHGLLDTTLLGQD